MAESLLNLLTEHFGWVLFTHICICLRINQCWGTQCHEVLWKEKKIQFRGQAVDVTDFLDLWEMKLPPPSTSWRTLYDPKRWKLQRHLISSWSTTLMINSFSENWSSEWQKNQESVPWGELFSVFDDQGSSPILWRAQSHWSSGGYGQTGKAFSGDDRMNFACTSRVPT